MDHISARSIREFNWEPLYYRTENTGDYATPDLPQTIVKCFREWNVKDYELYDKAKGLFEEKKRAYGKSFEQDLARFRKNLKRHQSCEQVVAPSPAYQQDWVCFVFITERREICQTLILRYIWTC